MLEIHCRWNRGDPKDRGTFDTEITQAFVIPVAAKKSYDIDSARINLIYGLRASNPSANAYTIKIYSKTARAAADLIYTSGPVTGSFNEQNNAGSRLVVAVDKDKTAHIFMTVEGTNGDTVTVVCDVVRLS
jgi:hypothetical protein